MVHMDQVADVASRASSAGVARREDATAWIPRLHAQRRRRNMLHQQPLPNPIHTADRLHQGILPVEIVRIEQKRPGRQLRVTPPTKPEFSVSSKGTTGLIFGASRQPPGRWR